MTGYNCVGLCSEIDIFTYLLIGGPTAKPNIFLFPDTIILTRETEGGYQTEPPRTIQAKTDTSHYLQVKTTWSTMTMEGGVTLVIRLSPFHS